MEEINLEYYKNLTREQTIEEHRKLWNWLADNPTKQKCEYPVFRWLSTLGYHIINDCFCCDYVDRNKVDECFGDYCANLCPIDWRGKPNNGEPRKCTESFYADYIELYILKREYSKVSHYARLIANLPESN